MLVNVWASWCEPCRDELPLIEKAHKMIPRSGGTVLGIDVKENSGAALKAVGEFGLSFPNLRDRDGSFVREWGQTGYPENYVIDRRATSPRCAAPGHAGVARRDAAAAAGRGGLMAGAAHRAARPRAARRAGAPPRRRSASLPDIEDEVMCLECGTR